LNVLSCEDRANLRTLQIIETEKQAKVNISSLNKEEKKMILISAEKTQGRLILNSLTF
jgi:hypothetical protein